MNTVGVPRETFPGERRVALTPAAVQAMAGAGLQVNVEAGAGLEAGFPDDAYRDKGATIVAIRREVFACTIVAQVRTFPANRGAGAPDLELVRADQPVVGLASRSPARRGASSSREPAPGCSPWS